MAEMLVEFAEPVIAEDGRVYVARACGSEMRDGRWQGWIEFTSPDATPVRSARETTQPNRQDTVYWATGLTAVYLEGSLRRALNPLVRPAAREIPPPAFDGPASASEVVAPASDSVLNPFSVYRKGEALLRRQLAALSGWHLVNIIRNYRLSDQDAVLLSAAEPAELVELIVSSVRQSQTDAVR